MTLTLSLSEKAGRISFGRDMLNYKLTDVKRTDNAILTSLLIDRNTGVVIVLQSLTVEEFMTFIKALRIRGVVLNILSAFNHVSISDVKIILYNKQDEYDRITTDKQLEIIPVNEIESVSISFDCHENVFVKLKPFGGMILFVES